MSLLREIQADAVNGATDLPTVLRKAKLLAARIGFPELAAWVDHELRGYRDKDRLPAYRVIPCLYRANFMHPAAAANNVQVMPEHFPDPELVRPTLQMQMFQSVGELTELLKGDSQSFRLGVPAGLGAYLDGRVYRHMNCVALWREIQRPQVVRILDGVRDALLSFSIDLEERFPSLAVGDTVNDEKKNEKLSESFNLHVTGTGNTVNIGNRDVQQSITVDAGKGDWQNLESELRRIGVPDVEIVELKDVLAEEQTPVQGQLPPKTATWLGKMVGRAAQGAWQISASTAGGTLARLLSVYFGIGG